tara:strand:+ start:430 stop:681 length:252 start_codon:yes stop_codon:yes gene_type:complete
MSRYATSGRMSGTCVVEQSGYTLELEYTHDWESGDGYLQPPSASTEITQVRLNGMDITDFYFDCCDGQHDDEVSEHAEDNKYE